jgi:hypothetical protein
MSKCWVLTREINEYDQDGEYFEAVFAEKPDYDKMAKLLFDLGWDNKELTDHVLNGGGRVYREETWYHLREVDML